MIFANVITYKLKLKYKGFFLLKRVVMFRDDYQVIRHLTSTTPLCLEIHI